MTNTYSWDFGAIERLGVDDEGHENVVTVIHWKYIADNGEGVTASRASATLLFREEDAESWIEYSDIKRSDFVGWVESDLGEDRLASIQAKLDGEIEAQVSVSKDTVLEAPWGDEGSE